MSLRRTSRFLWWLDDKNHTILGRFYVRPICDLNDWLILREPRSRDGVNHG